ncbi:MAG: sugar phosphate isomerase/epimerase [Anaerolineae bacterium]|nr:sugar phosphate isomerase/epimerase [Anaerolineae bacterium]
MIEFSCHTWAFNDLTLPEALGTIARLGFRRVDIGSGTHLNAARAAERPQAVASEIREDLSTFNLNVADLYLMLPRISIDAEDKRQAEIQLYRALLPFAQAIGTPGITLSPGLAHPADDVEARDRTVAALRDMVKAGKAAGLHISIEPHLDSMAPTPEAALKLVTEVPGLQITLDWAHMVCQGIRDKDILPLLPHTRHVHIRQAARNKLQTRFDQGKIDLASVYETLTGANYTGVICVEYMKTVGWHGMADVDTTAESVRVRDTLREARSRAAAIEHE